MMIIKNIIKSVIIVTTQEYSIPVVFHNGSIYDYHFIIKESAKEF